MSRNRFKYKKPGKDADKGSWIEVRKGDKDNIDIIAAVVNSCLNENEQVLWQNFQVTSTNLYINSKLEQQFSDKEKELEGVLHEKPSQMFAFGLVRTKTHADEVCERGSFFRQILHVPLGDDTKGVNVVKHADVLLTWASKKRCQRPWLIVYRIMVGRSKTVKARFVSQAPQVNPTPNADSHVCKEVDSNSDLVCEQLNQSQIFLFEVDKQGCATKHPRHCLPYAVISYKQRDVPLTLNPSTSANQRNRAPIPRRDSSSDNPSRYDENENRHDRTASPLSHDEGDALTRYLEQEALSLEDLDSNHLDSELDDIKRQRESVMLKLKAIQNMREALTSTTSCSSESEQEVDKKIQKIHTSSSSQDRIASPREHLNLNDSDRKMSNVEDGSSSRKDGSQLGKRLEIQRRRLSSGGRSDPYHWPPRTEHAVSQDGRGNHGGEDYDFSRDDLPHEQAGPSHGGQIRDFDYYKNDEQSDMFDLDEMAYASQGKFAGKDASFKPKVSDEPGRFKVDVVKREAQDTGNSEDPPRPRQMSSNKMESRQRESAESDMAGGDNHLTSDTLIRDMDIDESSQSSNSGMAFHNSDNKPRHNETHQNNSPTRFSHGNYNNSAFNLISDVGTYPARQLNMEFKSPELPTQFFHEQGRTPTKFTSPQCFPPSPHFNNIPENSIQRMGATLPGVPGEAYHRPSPTKFTSPQSFISSVFNDVSNQCRTSPAGLPGDSYTTPTKSYPHDFTGFNNIPDGRIQRPDHISPGLSYHSGSPNKLTPQNYMPDRRDQRTECTSPNQTYESYQRATPINPHDYANSVYNTISGTNGQDLSTGVSHMDYTTQGHSSNTFQSQIDVSLPPPASQVFTNSVFSISGGMQTNMSEQQANTLSNPMVNPDDASRDASYPPSSHSSSDTPRSDFSGSQVISRGVDGRLRLTCSTTSSPIVPSSGVAFPKPPSPPSVDPYPEGVMSPSGPIIPHFEFESNLIEAEPERNNNINAAKDSITVGSRLSKGQLSAIVALQQQMAQTTNATQRCALQVALNTLIGVQSKGDTVDSLTSTAFLSTAETPAQSDSHPPVKTSPESKISKPKSKTVKMFYGHTLIKKGKKPPRHIEQEPLPDKPVPVDPRPARSSLLGRKFEVSLDILPWFKRKRVSPLKRQQSMENEKTDMDCNPVTDPQQNLRDPRIRKQIITDVLLAVASIKDSGESKPQPNEAHDVKEEGAVNQLHPQSCPKQNEQQNRPETPEDDDIVVLSVHPAPGRETPESGEITDDSPLRIDTRTVVLRKHGHREKMCTDGAQKKGIRKVSDQPKILDKFKYVQNIDVSIPDSAKQRKVEVKENQDTVFDRLGRKRSNDGKQNFDLRQKLSGHDLRQKIKGKKSEVLTGYGIRDEFLHCESSNDSSIVEVKKWSPPASSSTSESFADSFKWYDRKPLDPPPLMSLKEFDNPSGSTSGRYRERKQSSFDLELDSYARDRDALQDQITRERSWSTDGFFKEEWNIQDAGRTRSWDYDNRNKELKRHDSAGDKNMDARRNSSAGDGYGDRLRDDRNASKENYTKDTRYPNNRSMSQERSPHRGSRDIWSRSNWSKDRSHHDTSRSGDTRSRRSLSKDRSYHDTSRSGDARSRRSPSRSSLRCASRDGPSFGRSSRDGSPARPSQGRSSRGGSPVKSASQGSFSRERSSKRSLSKERFPHKSESNSSRLSQEQASKDNTSIDAANKNQHNKNSATLYRHDGRTQLAGSLSVMPSKQDDLLSDISSTSDYFAKEDSDKSESLDERLEKEHGIIPAKKRKLSSESTPNNMDTQKKSNPSYKSLCLSLTSLKQRVADAARSFRDLNKHELQSRILRYQQRYKNLQDMAIRVLECHYEGDRVPSEADRDIQQRLLEMITDIECQREGLDKYKTCTTPSSYTPTIGSTKRSKMAAQEKDVANRTSSDVASQMYKFSTKSPARSATGSSQKKRCP